MSSKKRRREGNWVNITKPYHTQSMYENIIIYNKKPTEKLSLLVRGHPPLSEYFKR